ncbi:hypothetical protein JCM10207_005839 [Rhodosporidiobolus poonsookiae]
MPRYSSTGRRSADYNTSYSLDKRTGPTRLSVTTPMQLPRASYLHDLEETSTERDIAEPKSKLLVSDLDNTLFGPNPSTDGVVARPYLKTFIKYIMHPSTPYNLAIWTFSGRCYGIAHLRQCGMGKYLFDSDSLDAPQLKPGLLALWGYEDSGFTAYGQMAAGQPLKDLDLMTDFINVTRHLEFNSGNTLLVDDQKPNARAQPDSLVRPPVFTNKMPDDDFLLAFIGVLEDLSVASNIPVAIGTHEFQDGIPLKEIDMYVAKAKKVCARLGIRVSRGEAYPDPTYVEDVKQSKHAACPVHDAAPEPTEPHPTALPYGRPTPKRIAEGMTLHPSAEYKREIAIPSQVGRVGRPLIVFDLDGTLYTRPPQVLEHDPATEPSGRPYLRSFLQWLLRPESPWTVAIWTGSQKATAVKCLYELDLGLVGPELVGRNKDRAELLHPKLVALWAREDFGLTRKDFYSYVSVVKDLDRLWGYLDRSHLGSFSPLNTVMVDDTPSKLRAQPSTLIAAPTYDYPLAPSPATSAAQLDTFLLALAGMLDVLALETNFANYIDGEGWNKVMEEEEIGKWAKKGVQLLKKAGIMIAAEGRGLLPGVESSGDSLAALRRASISDVNSDTDNDDDSSSSSSGSSKDSYVSDDD